jgi:hypothetical protein
MGIDCPNMYQHTGIAPGTFVEGYVVIHTPAELDVVTVYTAGAPNVATLHTERVPFRRVPIVVQPAACADLNLNLTTGVANWLIRSDPDTSTTEPRAASVVTTPNPNWISLPPAKWIGPKTTSSNGGAVGDYQYQLCFCLCRGYSNASLTLTGLSDDAATVSLNGNSLGSLAGFAGPAKTVQTSDPNMFEPGTNCVIVTVNNATGPTGLNMTGSVTATAGQCSTGTTTTGGTSN